MKELIRKILFPLAVLLGGDFVAKEGTFMCRFFMWLYDEEGQSAR